MWTLEDAPGGALVECADFLFLSSRSTRSAESLASRLKQERQGAMPSSWRATPRSRRWRPPVFGGDASPTRRYAFHKGGEDFDRSRLARFADAAPPEVRVCPFDRETYRMAMAAPWSRSFCEQFRSEEDFLARGLGMGRRVQWRAGGRSLVLYLLERRHRAPGGNKAGYAAAGHRPGLLRPLILRCLDRGLYPSWDAANPESAALAARLGYRIAGPYDAWELYPA